MSFDIEGARRAGYSDAEIIDFLAPQRRFDAAAARESGHSDADILGHLAAPQRTTGERVARVAGQVGAGFNERLAQTAGALPDLYNRGLRAIGLPALAPGAYTGAIQSGINAVVGQPQAPEGTTERFARGAGQGVADAATVLMPAAGLAQTARVGGLTQGAAQALASQPAMQVAAGAVGGGVGEATGDPLLGTAAAFATPLVAGAARRAITPVQAPVDPERARLAAAAAAEGIPLTAGQRTGSRALQNVEGAFATLPTTAGPQARLATEQAEAFTAAALRRAGAGGSRATPEVLDAAQTRIGGTIGSIADRTTAQLSPAVQQRYLDLVDDVSRNAAPEVRNQVTNRLDDIMQLAREGGTMEGRAVRELDSAIGRQIQGAQGDLRRYLRDAQGVLRDAMTAGATREDARALRDARRQYSNLIRVENAMASPGAAAAEGLLSPNALRAATAQGDRRGYALGRGEMNELSRIGQAFIRSGVPNSGTAERTLMANLLTGGGVGGGAVMLGAEPVTAAATAATTLLAPRAAQAAYNSPWMQRWIQNEVLRGSNRPGQGVDLARALMTQQLIPALTAP